MFKNLLLWILLTLLALVGLLLSIPIALAIHLSYRIVLGYYHVLYYIQSIAIGLDALAGSFIYGSKRHTVSAMTGYFAFREKTKWHIKQAKFIDFFFGKNHCYYAMRNEGL